MAETNSFNGLKDTNTCIFESELFLITSVDGPVDLLVQPINDNAVIKVIMAIHSFFNNIHSLKRYCKLFAFNIL